MVSTAFLWLNNHTILYFNSYRLSLKLVHHSMHSQMKHSSYLSLSNIGKVQYPSPSFSILLASCTVASLKSSLLFRHLTSKVIESEHSNSMNMFTVCSSPLIRILWMHLLLILMIWVPVVEELILASISFLYGIQNTTKGLRSAKLIAMLEPRDQKHGFSLDLEFQNWCEFISMGTVSSDRKKDSAPFF